MNEASNKPKRFVTCRCHYCEGDINFDASGFNEGETCTLTCPHCQTETSAAIPPLTNVEIANAKRSELEMFEIQKITRIKSTLRARLENGKSAFIYDSVYIPVNSKLLDDEFADEFDVSFLRKLGMLGWDVVQAVPRTVGIGLTNESAGNFLVGGAWGAGIGGNVAGVHIILKKNLSASDLTDDPDDETGKFIRKHLSDFVTE